MYDPSTAVRKVLRMPHQKITYRLTPCRGKDMAVEAGIILGGAGTFYSLGFVAFCRFPRNCGDGQRNALVKKGLRADALEVMAKHVVELREARVIFYDPLEGAHDTRSK